MPDRLLDANALSAAMKGDERFARYLQSLPEGDRIVTSTVAEGEVRFGIERLPAGRRRHALSEAFEQIVETLHDIVPVTRDVALVYARVKAAAWRAGRPPGENDMWIAATALAFDCALATNDTGFDCVDGLQRDDWSKS